MNYRMDGTKWERRARKIRKNRKYSKPAQGSKVKRLSAKGE
jgi:hypothetical protein